MNPNEIRSFNEEQLKIIAYHKRQDALEEKLERTLKRINDSTDIEALRDVRSWVEAGYKTIPNEGKEDLHVLFHAINNRIEELLK